MTNSVSPLLTPIDVLAYPHSIQTLGFDEVSDLVFHWGRVWFLWHIRPRKPEREKIPNSPGKVGIASMEIDESGNLGALRSWPLPLPPNCIPVGAVAKSPEFKIASVVGSNLVAVVTLNYDRPKVASTSESIVLRFSPETERWYLGAYGAVTKKFRFHAVETPADITSDKLAAVIVSNTIIVYTHDEDVYGGFDNTQYTSEDWERSPEVSRLLDLSFYQKIQFLLPHAAPFIFLDSPTGLTVETGVELESFV